MNLISLGLVMEQGKKNKKLFWVPAVAPLISVIISTFFVYITRADKQGVQIVRTHSTKVFTCDTSFLPLC